MNDNQPQTTHWVGCWEQHLDCALDKIRRLEQACNDSSDRLDDYRYRLDLAREEIDRLRWEAFEAREAAK